MHSEEWSAERAVEQALIHVRSVADRTGYVLNPDESHTWETLKLLAANKAEHGRYFCPTQASLTPGADDDPICPCPSIGEDIRQQGHCACGLFYDLLEAIRSLSGPGSPSDIGCPT